MTLTLSVPSVNHSVSYNTELLCHARALHTNLSQQLGIPTDLTAPPAASSTSTTTASATQLRQLVSCNAKLARALARSNTDPTAVEDADELQAACQQRQELLSELLHTLDSSVLGLRSQLDACHKLLHTLPCKEDPEMIIRYAHTLRHAFAPLGSAPGLPPVPPAPQVPFMLHSALRLYHMDVVAQKAGQQQPGQQLPEAPAIPQPLQPGAPATAALELQPAAEAAAPVAAAAPAAAAAVAPLLNFRLNADMSDEEDEASHETVSESEHITSSSEDFEEDTE